METEQRLCSVFNTALVNCARIQAVVKAEDLTGTPVPKESFLVILMRNAVSKAHTGLFSLYVFARSRVFRDNQSGIHLGRMFQWYRFFHDISVGRQFRF